MDSLDSLLLSAAEHGTKLQRVSSGSSQRNPVGWKGSKLHDKVSGFTGLIVMS